MAWSHQATSHYMNQYWLNYITPCMRLCMMSCGSIGHNHYWWFFNRLFMHILTHWGRVTHICVSELTIIGSDNGLVPGRRQAIIWTNVGILLIGPIGTNFNKILMEIHIISFKKMHLKMSSGNGGHFVSASMCWRKHQSSMLLHGL